MIPIVVISARGEERLESGHPWIYRADVAQVRAQETAMFRALGAGQSLILGLALAKGLLLGLLGTALGVGLGYLLWWRPVRGWL